MRFASLIPVLFCSLAAFAQVEPVGTPVIADTASETTSDEKPNKPRVTESIVVTATRNERAVSELPVSTTVVSQEKMESAPATNVDDLLRTLPGVHVPLLGSTAHQPQSSRISMRGLGGTRALVLLDGVPVHDSYHGTVQWQKIPVETVRQVEVVRGGSAGLFGNYSMGGTINLLTRLDLRGRALSRSYGEPKNRFPQPAHEVFDVYLSHPVRPWLQAYVLAENVLDEEYYYALATGTPRAARPRTWLSGFRLRFGSHAGQ